MEPQESLNKTLEMLKSVSTNVQPLPSTEQPPRSLPVIKNPCSTAWQQKWLRLDVHDPRLQKLGDEAEAFCGRFMRCNRNKSLLVAMGDTNCGKTHTSRAVANFCRGAAFMAFEMGAWDKGGHIPSVHWVDWPALVNRWTEHKDYSEMQDLIETDLLLVDDIGAERDPFNMTVDKLCQVLSRREDRFTMVTLNVRPEAWANKWDVRVADRFFRNSVVVDLFGVESYAIIQQRQ